MSLHSLALCSSAIHESPTLVHGDLLVPGFVVLVLQNFPKSYIWNFPSWVTTYICRNEGALFIQTYGTHRRVQRYVKGNNPELDGRGCNFIWKMEAFVVSKREQVEMHSQLGCGYCFSNWSENTWNCPWFSLFSRRVHEESTLSVHLFITTDFISEWLRVSRRFNSRYIHYWLFWIFLIFCPSPLPSNEHQTTLNSCLVASKILQQKQKPLVFLRKERSGQFSSHAIHKIQYWKCLLGLSNF